MSGRRLTLRKRAALEIQRRLENDLRTEHPLKQLFWECTLRCNLHCRHCGSDCKTSAQQSDMPLNDFLHVLDSVERKYRPEDVFIAVSGGEPLMRDDLEQCGRAFSNRGYSWGMVSNGLYLTPERYEKLRESGLTSVTISLDGLEQNHNWMRGHSDSFNKASRAIDILLADHEMVFDVVTCVTEHNYEELPALRQFLKEKGVKDWRLLTVFPMGRAAKNSEMQLTKMHFRGLMDFILETRQQKQIHTQYGCEGFLGGYEFDVRDGAYICMAGVTVASVLIDGSISACTSIRADYHQGNIYRDDFLDVWENRFELYRSDEWKHTGECADCKLFRYCRGGGMHLHDSDGSLLLCHYKRLE